MTCDECEMLTINGCACHESGCPNMQARWDGEDWQQQTECRECGCTVDCDSRGRFECTCYADDDEEIAR